jgi:hypothetical protein
MAKPINTFLVVFFIAYPYLPISCSSLSTSCFSVGFVTAAVAFFSKSSSTGTAVALTSLDATAATASGATLATALATATALAAADAAGGGIWSSALLWQPSNDALNTQPISMDLIILHLPVWMPLFAHAARFRDE